MRERANALEAALREIEVDGEGKPRDYLGPDVWRDVEIAARALENQPTKEAP